MATTTRAPEAQEMMDCVRALVRRFGLSERADVSCCGITVAQAATLETLRASGPLGQADLSRRLGIAPSTLTRNLARLVEAGLVARIKDPEDARASRVRLSPAGRRAADEVRRQEHAFAEAVFEHLPPGKRASIAEGLKELVSAVRDVTESCCPGAYDHLVQDFAKERNDGTCC